MARLILVRHAAVELRDGDPPATWQLSAAGRAAAERLACWPGWPGVTLIASSPEPKARDTASPLAAAAGLVLRIEHDLREAGRPAQRIVTGEEIVATSSSYLRGEPVDGWEGAADVRRRVTRCIDRLVAAAPGDVAVVSHGLALSLFLGLDPEQWERIPLPAVAVVEPETRRLLEPWASADRSLCRPADGPTIVR